MAAAEQKKSYHVSKNFKGLNTKAQRTAIDPDEFSWIENIMPIGYANLKTVGNQTQITDNTGNVVVGLANVTYMSAVTLKGTEYLLGFEIGGGAEYFNHNLRTKGIVAAPGTFSDTGVRVTQWENTYALIADPNKGLFQWDGTNLVPIGSVGLVTVVSGGANYTIPPTVTFSAPDYPAGTQATGTCTISNGSGSISSIQVGVPGSGYTSVPTVTIGAPDQQGGTQAVASAIIQSGNVVGVTVTNPGLGYTAPPSVTITGGGGSNATATAILAYGSVLTVNVTEAGTGYSAPPTISFSGGGGTGANAVASLVTFATGGVTLDLVSGGTGYTTAPLVTISGGGGTNATAVCTLTGNTVGAVVVLNPGTGYTNAANIVVTLSGGGGGNGANITANIATTQTVDVQTYSGRTWLAQGRQIFYSAAGTYNDFGTVSAGNIILTDSTLLNNIIKLLSANNFLYIFGDDSINVFSDVRVSSSGITLFTNTNVSASIGTDLPLALFPYFRSVLFMNKYGVYALVGSTTSKISDQLDGIFPNIDFTYPVYAAQALIFNILCAIFQFWYKDPATGVSRPLQAVFFEKKWFLTSQGANITHITPLAYSGRQEIYADDGGTLVEFYTNSTANIAATLETALLPMDDPIRTKQALKFGVEAITGYNGTELAVTVDSEQGSSAPYNLANSIQWLNNLNDPIPWTNYLGNQIGWVYTSGYVLFKSDAAQWGKYLGLTITSDSPQTIYNTYEFEHELRVRF